MRETFYHQHKSSTGPPSPRFGGTFRGTHFKGLSQIEEESKNISKKICDQNNPILLPSISPRGYIKFEKSSIPY